MLFVSIQIFFLLKHLLQFHFFLNAKIGQLNEMVLKYFEVSLLILSLTFLSSLGKIK